MAKLLREAVISNKGRLCNASHRAFGRGSEIENRGIYKVILHCIIITRNCPHCAVLVYLMLHHRSMTAYHILSIVWFRIIWLTAASSTSSSAGAGLVTTVSLGGDPGSGDGRFAELRGKCPSRKPVRQVFLFLL